MKKLITAIILVCFTSSNFVYAKAPSTPAPVSSVKLSDIVRDAIVYGASDEKLLKMGDDIDKYLAGNNVGKEEAHELRVIQNRIINYFIVKRTFSNSGTSSSGSKRIIHNTLRAAFIDTDEPEFKLKDIYTSNTVRELVSPTFLLDVDVYASNKTDKGSPIKPSLKGIGNPGVWDEFVGLFTGKKPEIDNAEVNKIGGIYDYQATLWLKTIKNSLKTLLFYGQIYPASLYYNNSITSVSNMACSIGSDDRSLCTTDVLNELNRTGIEYKYDELRELKSYTPQNVADDLCGQIRQLVVSNPIYEEMGCYPQYYHTLGDVNDNGLPVNNTRFRKSITYIEPEQFALSDRLEDVQAKYETDIRNNICAQYTTSLAPIKASSIGTLLLTDSLQGLNCDIYSEKNKEFISEAERSSINSYNVGLVRGAITESVNMVLDHIDKTNEGFKDSFINAKKGKPYKDDHDIAEYVVENIKDLMELNPVAAAQTLVSQPSFIPLLAGPIFEQIDSDKEMEEITDTIVRAGTYIVGGVCAILAIVAPYAGIPALAAYAGVLGTTSTVLFVAGTTYSGVRSYEEYQTYNDLMNVIQSQNGDQLSLYEMQNAYSNAIDLAYETAINGTLISLSAAISILAKTARTTAVTNELGTIDDVIAFEKQGSKTPLSKPGTSNNKGGYYKHPGMKDQGVKINPIEAVDDVGTEGWWGFPGSGSGSGPGVAVDVLPVTRTTTKPVVIPDNKITTMPTLGPVQISPNTATVTNTFSYSNYLNLGVLNSLEDPLFNDPLESPLVDGPFLNPLKKDIQAEPLKLHVNGETYVQDAHGFFVNVKDRKIYKTKYILKDGRMLLIDEPEGKFYEIRYKVEDDYAREFHEDFEEYTVEQIRSMAKPIPRAFQGMSGANVMEVELDGKEYILKDLGGNKHAIGTALNEIRSADWYHYNELGPKAYLLKTMVDGFLGFRKIPHYYLLVEKVKGINIKDIVLDPYFMSKWQHDKPELLKKEIEKSLGRNFKTVSEACVAFAKAVIADHELMIEVFRARELIRSTFSGVDDLQFLLQPRTKSRKTRFNFIDCGRNNFFTNYDDYRKFSSYELDYLMDVLEEISKADPEVYVPWVKPPGTDPWTHPMMLK